MKITINQNKEIVEIIRADLKRNNGYCPCKLEQIPENKCMCKEFMEQKNGYCHCGLYFKEEE